MLASIEAPPTNEPSINTPYSRVYTSYQFEALPAHPGPQWTRFVCISDTHNAIFRLPPGDILIHAGDLMSWAPLKKLEATINWIKSADHETKLVIAGNHDEVLDPEFREDLDDYKDINTHDLAKALMRSPNTVKAGLLYLEYQSTVIPSRNNKDSGWTVYGSPATPRFGLGAFQYSTPEEAEKFNQRIPQDVQILITHSPPLGILDTTIEGKKAGCPVLAGRVTELLNCRLHVFGHIHAARGAILMVRPGGGTPIVFVNAAGTGGPQCQPIIVDLLNNC